jgi:Na+/melibiose symporter-like transporter
VAGLASLSYMLISPGPYAALLLGAALLCLNAMVVVEGVAAPAVLADIVDYGRWRFGVDHAGTYFALFGMIQKINVGIGAAIGLAIAGAFGFEAAAQTQTSGGLFGLLLAFSALPGLSYIVSAWMILRFPIDRRRQQVLVKAIARRELRATRTAVEAEAGAAR